MAAVVTFDGPNRRITEINTGLPTTDLSLQEVYSEWKEWVKLSSTNAGIIQAFRYAGADPVSATEETGTTFFIMNGWKLVPADYAHQLNINGNLFTDPPGASRTDFSTITAMGVEVVYNVSVLVEQGAAAGAATDVGQIG